MVDGSETKFYPNNKISKKCYYTFSLYKIFRSIFNKDWDEF